MYLIELNLERSISMKKMLSIILLLGCTSIFYGCNKTSNENTSEPVINEVQNKSVEVYGVVKTYEYRDINLDISARVESVNVKEGEIISQGTAIMSLDLSDYQARITAKKYELDQEMLILESIKKQTSIKEEELIQMQNKLKYLKNNLDKENDPNIKNYKNKYNLAKEVYDVSLKKLKSLKKQYNSSSISSDELEDYELKVSENQNNIKEIELNLENYKQERKLEINELLTKINASKMNLENKGKDSYDIQIQTEKIQMIEEELDYLQSKLDTSFLQDNNVILDMDKGLIDDMGYVTGDVFQSGSTLFRVYDMNTMYIQADVPEEFIKDVSVGEEVKITPLAYKSETIKGRVSRISNKADNVGGITTIKVDIESLDKEHQLKPNYNVDIELSME